MKHYLVTGGAGFIGSNFIHFLKKTYGDDIHIINLDALTYCGNCNNVSVYEGSNTYQFIQGNICSDELVNHIFKDYDIDYVVHFAAQTHVDRSISSADEFAQTNVIGTLNLLNAALNHWKPENYERKRFLYISTDEVYGDLPEEGYFTEATPLRPRNPYSASKAAGDMMAHAFYETHGLPVLTTRCSNNYGPYQYEEKFIPLCIQYCLKGIKLPVYGDGLNIRDWLYVEDHCRAIDLVLQRGNVGEVYNIGGHNEHTNLEITETLRTILRQDYHIKVPEIQFVEDRKGHDRRYAIDPAKIRNELGWQPETSFEEGIRKTIRWYMEHPEFLGVRMGKKS
jgi:dTDP-glucose 4,6-dehydratase